MLTEVQRIGTPCPHPVVPIDTNPWLSSGVILPIAWGQNQRPRKTVFTFPLSQSEISQVCWNILNRSEMFISGVNTKCRTVILVKFKFAPFYGIFISLFLNSWRLCKFHVVKSNTWNDFVVVPVMWWPQTIFFQTTFIIFILIYNWTRLLAWRYYVTIVCCSYLYLSTVWFLLG